LVKLNFEHQGESVIRKFFGTIITIALVFNAGVAANATDAAPGDSYQAENTSVDASSQVLSVISDKAGNDWTGLMRGGGGNPNHPDWTNCESLQDPSCDFRSGDQFYQGNAVLQSCSVTKSDFCISSLELAAPGGDFQPASYVGESKQTVWEADPTINFPGGGGAALFQAPNAPTAGGQNSYAVEVTLKFNWNPGMTHFDIHEIFASVLPYRGVEDPNIRGIAGWGENAGGVCAWTQPGFCGVGQDWVPGTRARLTFSMPNTIAGWFKGRITSPEISITAKSAGVNQVTVAAEPVAVPQLAIAQPKAEKDALLQTGMDLGTWGGPGFEEIGLQANSRSVAQFIERYRSQLGDSSTGKTSQWNFATVNGGGGSDCLASSDKVLGIVTTNAMGYDGSAPSFENETLTYHVSGMHYESDKKTLTEGTYDLVMRSDVARCLYGFTSAPISATVSVIDDKGQAKTAVTVVNEKNGWLKMAAYGFSFSNPTLNVKISQAKLPTPAPKKISITCTKGKLVKKISGTSPKCPSGYKKKA
jgi:hypothetical protein